MTNASGPVPPHKLYVPLVHGDGMVAAASADMLLAARKLFRLIHEHAEQERERLVWDDDIARVARLRVEDMRARQYISHVTPEGLGPNAILRANGITLPDYYGQAPTDNQVESVSLRPMPAATVLAEMLKSPTHHDHLLGVGWFSTQWRGAVACGPDWNVPPKQFIWCFLSVGD